MTEAMQQQIYNQAQYATLQEVLALRDRRSARQQALLEGHRCVVSYSLNIPGPNKTAPLFAQTFQEGLTLLDDCFQQHGLVCLDREVWTEKGGFSAVMALEEDPLSIKALVVQLEDLPGIGRFFDMDVLEATGQPLSRTALGFEERGCFLCGKPGKGCARSRAHTVEELLEKTVEVLSGYLAVDM